MSYTYYRYMLPVTMTTGRRTSCSFKNAPPPHSHVAHLLLAVAVVVGCVAVSEIVALSLVALHEVALCLPS